MTAPTGPLTLRGAQTLPNRLAKASMSEQLGHGHSGTLTASVLTRKFL